MENGIYLVEVAWNGSRKSGPFKMTAREAIYSFWQRSIPLLFARIKSVWVFRERLMSLMKNSWTSQNIDFQMTSFSFSPTSPHQTTNFPLRSAAIYVTCLHPPSSCSQKTSTWKACIWNTARRDLTIGLRQNSRATLTYCARLDGEGNWG